MGLMRVTVYAMTQSRVTIANRYPPIVRNARCNRAGGGFLPRRPPGPGFRPRSVRDRLSLADPIGWASVIHHASLLPPSALTRPSMQALTPPARSRSLERTSGVPVAFGERGTVGQSDVAPHF